MSERQKRLIEVYEHLRRYFGIHTKTGFAEAIHYGRTSLSAAMNGDDSYLTDNLFKNICEAYPKTFNLEYLLNGEGTLLTIEEEVSSDRIDELARKNEPIDNSSLVNAALAAKDQVIAHMELRISEKDETIRTQRQLIQALQQQVTDFRARYEIGNLEKYPFPVGSAEPGPNEHDRVNV